MLNPYVPTSFLSTSSKFHSTWVHSQLCLDNWGVPYTFQMNPFSNGKICTSYAHLWSTTLYPLHPPILDQMDNHLILSNHSQLTSYLKSNLYFIMPISLLYYFPSSPWPHELMMYVNIFILVSTWILHSPSLLILLYHWLNHHHHPSTLACSCIVACGQSQSFQF